MSADSKNLIIEAPDFRPSPSVRWLIGPANA
jgi:hypothetical protein